ncbi:metallophosphoesterase family protein [Salsuginibacillus kocurii]|uniref:metallophosphoesterase family protein n=1 Tax=Salsuginibacillus kocurii TaxID=427078 RepID=UPI00036173E9|nr:metallophosphoesterase family protein [Salsuginibacillus kocurii]
MKTAIISDIHGNARALKAILNDMEQQDVQQLYVIGDICFRGPEPKNALETVRALPAKVLQGNADLWTVRGLQKEEVPEKALAIMNQEREWTAERLTEADMDYLAQLPAEFYDEIGNGLKMHTFHATPDSLFEPVKKDASADELRNKLTLERDADVYVYGHVHTPFVREVNGKTIVNTGSVGLPFDHDPRPSYAIIDTSTGKIEATIRRVSYNLDEVINQYDANNYPNSEQMKTIIRDGAIK